MTAKKGERQATGESEKGDKTWELRLYVAGVTDKATTAFKNLKKICEEHLSGKYHIEVIDLLKNPNLAKDHQIVALPALIRKLPLPLRKIVGDLSNTERVLVGLDLKPRKLTLEVTSEEGKPKRQH